MNPEVNRTAFAGIDWGDSSHQVCVLDSEGTVLGEKAFAHSGEGLRYPSEQPPYKLSGGIRWYGGFVPS